MMDREQFINYLNRNQYTVIAYHFHLENGKQKLSYFEYVSKINKYL